MQYCRSIYLRKAKTSRLCCRDKVIEQERQLRQAAEERLQSHLTDLYNNPEVNRELRERLPRAGKSDPLDTSLTINDNSVEEGSVVDRMEKTQDTPKQRWDGWKKKIQTSKQMEGHRKLKKPAKKKKIEVFVSVFFSPFINFFLFLSFICLYQAKSKIKRIQFEMWTDIFCQGACLLYRSSKTFLIDLPSESGVTVRDSNTADHCPPCLVSDLVSKP